MLNNNAGKYPLGKLYDLYKVQLLWQNLCGFFKYLEARRALEMKSSPAKNIEQLVNNYQTPLKRDGKTRSSFGKGFLKFKRTRSVSEPNLCKKHLIKILI